MPDFSFFRLPRDECTVFRLEIIPFYRLRLSSPRDEAVPALPLSSRRRYLGYLIPLLNIPLFAWKAYEVSLRLSAGMQWNNIDVLNDLILLAMSLGLGLLLPWWAPVYGSRHWLTSTGVKIARFLKSTITIPYPSIARVEVYIRNRRAEGVSKEAIRYAKESVRVMRQSGFKFTDYTNAEDAIVLLLSESRIYMFSPAYPKAFIQKLRKRVRRLSVKMAELTPKGKRVKELAPKSGA